MGRCSCSCIWRVRKIPEKRANSGCQQSPVQATDGPAHALWSQRNARWIAEALLERTVIMQLGNWNSAHHLTMGLPQGTPLSAVLYNVSYTLRAWQIWTKMGPARFSYWQMTGSYTEHQKTIRKQSEQCSNNWLVYPSGVTAPDLSSVLKVTALKRIEQRHLFLLH